MLSALLRPFSKGGNSNSQAEDGHPDIEQRFPRQPSRYARASVASAGEYRQHRHATADFTEADDDDDEEESNHEQQQSRYQGAGARAEEDEDGLANSANLLPVFSAGHLGINNWGHFALYSNKY